MQTPTSRLSQKQSQPESKQASPPEQTQHTKQLPKQQQLQQQPKQQLQQPKQQQQQPPPKQQQQTDKPSTNLSMRDLVELQHQCAEKDRQIQDLGEKLATVKQKRLEDKIKLKELEKTKLQLGQVLYKIINIHSLFTCINPLSGNAPGYASIIILLVLYLIPDDSNHQRRMLPLSGLKVSILFISFKDVL